MFRSGYLLSVQTATEVSTPARETGVAGGGASHNPPRPQVAEHAEKAPYFHTSPGIPWLSADEDEPTLLVRL